MAFAVIQEHIVIFADIESVWEKLVTPDARHRALLGASMRPMGNSDPAQVFADCGSAGQVAGDVISADEPTTDGTATLTVNWSSLAMAVPDDQPLGRSQVRLTHHDLGTRVSVVHTGLQRSQQVREVLLGLWPTCLSVLKSHVESGFCPEDQGFTRVIGNADDQDAILHRSQAIDANNSTWKALPAVRDSVESAAELLATAYTAEYHWARAENTGPANMARAAYTIWRVEYDLGRLMAARTAAQRCLSLCEKHDLQDFDLAYAHEAMARSLAAGDEADEATKHWDLACAVPVSGDADREILEKDLSVKPLTAAEYRLQVVPQSGS